MNVLEIYYYMPKCAPSALCVLFYLMLPLTQRCRQYPPSEVRKLRLRKFK